MRVDRDRKLAIVIPAYKSSFLDVSLQSIANQTCKDFTLYVGDDCSPYDIEGIVDKYRDRINLVYKRFDTNLGGKNLVAQWERCIEMSNNEPYIWLFSDDDIMQPNCVEELIKHIEKTKGYYDLYHFDANIIDEKGNIISQKCNYPDVLSSYDYYKGKVLGKYPSYVVENVFSRDIYISERGFKMFDLAWGSDTATWAIFCGKKGIYKIANAHVNWRRSSQNISPNRTRSMSERKVMAVCSFLEWSYKYFENEKDIFSVNRKMFVNRMGRFKWQISRDCFHNALSSFFSIHGHQKLKFVTYLQILFYF